MALQFDLAVLLAAQNDRNDDGRSSEEYGSWLTLPKM